MDSSHGVTISLCSSGCCPKVQFCTDGSVLVVAHEEAGFVPLTREEAKLLAKAITDQLGE